MGDKFERYVKIDKCFCTILFSLILFLVYRLDAWKMNCISVVVYILLVTAVSVEDFKFAIFNKMWQIVVLDFVLSFCIIGNRLFVFPLDKAVGFHSVFLFLGFCVSCTPIAVFFLSQVYIRKFSSLGRCNSNISSAHFWLYFSIPIIIGCAMLYAFNPCIVSYDAHYVLAQAKGLEPVQEYVGVLYILWYRFLLSIVDSVTFLCIVQVFLYAVIISSFLYTLEILFGVRFFYLFLSFLIFSILPNNLMMLVTLTKDVYYAMFLALMSMALLMISLRGKACDYILLIVSNILTWTIRPSGIVVVLFATFSLFFSRLNKKRVTVVAVASLMLSISINFALSYFTDAEKTPGGMKYVALYQDILGVYYSNGQLSEGSICLVEKGVGALPDFKEDYTPYWAKFDDYYQNIHDIKISDFLSCYIETFLGNPVVMSRSILCRLDMMWDINPGLNAFESWQWHVNNSGGEWTRLVEKRSENGLTAILNIIGEKSKSYPYKSIFWRVGWCNILVFCVIISSKNKKIYLMLLPLAGFLLSYAVSLGWTHYRYYWADELLVYLFLVSAFASLFETEKKGSL